jgi:adenosylhomocysteine nucleosidase
MTSLLLRPGREKFLLRRHPWIFSGAIQHVEGEPVAGETVSLLASNRDFLARAAYSPTSQIRARVWTFEGEPVDKEFFRRRIRSAIQSRDTWHLTPDTSHLTPDTWPLAPDTSHLAPDTYDLTLFHSGWGKISSAAMMQYVIDHYSPDVVVNLGTCGGFAGLVEQGDVILVEKTFVYDIVELMSTEDVLAHYASSLDLSWLPEPYPFAVRRGTLASADSDLHPEKIPFLISKGAIAADWESAALAWVARKNNTRLLILRTVSDIVHEQGSDAYNNYEVFEARCGEIMKRLFDQLPKWLSTIQI